MKKFSSDNLKFHLSNLPNSKDRSRIFLELIAGYHYQQLYNTRFDEAIDALSEKLDLGEMAIRALKKSEVDELADVIYHSNIDELDTEQLFRELGGNRKTDPQFVNLRTPPAWLIKSLLSLINPDQPVLFINTSNSAFIPQILIESSKKYDQSIEFTAVDSQKDFVDNLRLMISLVEKDLEKIQASVSLLPENLEMSSDNQLDLIDNGAIEILPGEFGTIYIDLFSQSIRQAHTQVELTQNFHLLLNGNLSPDGRVIISGSSNFLDGQVWAKLRDGLQAKYQIESIADFSFAEQTYINGSKETPAFISFRKPQQVVTKRITIFSPADFSGFNAKSENPLEDLIEVVLTLDQAVMNGDVSIFQKVLASKKAYVFDLPSSELVDRWDAKYYSPGRQQLQDQLISNPDITWLGAISELIAQGTPRSMLVPYGTATLKIDYSSTKESFAPLRVRDQVWLNLVDERSEEFEGDILVRVERRSGSLIGYMDEEFIPKLLDPAYEDDERYPASVTNIKDETSSKRLSVTIQFVPLEERRYVEYISIIRPKDITSKRLTSTGEPALIPREMRERLTFLKAGDILLYLGRGSVNACVVPSRWEGSICHQDMSIIRPKHEQVDSYYLLSFLLGSDFHNQLRYILRSGTFHRIDIQEFEELLVILPPLAEQRRFALTFAEGRGDLDVSDRRTELAAYSLTAEEYEQLISNFVSEITSDIDQLHDFDDWLRLKRERVREIKDLLMKYEDASQIEEIRAISALDKVSDALETYRASSKDDISQKKLIEARLIEFEDAILGLSNNYGRKKLSELARTLGNLLRAQYVPANIEIWLEEDTFPAGTPYLLSLSISTNSPENLHKFEILPSLSSGSFVEKPEWYLDILEESELYSFQAYARFDEPGLAYVDCAIRFSESDGSRVEQKERLSFQILPAAEAPFTAIYPNPYITGLPVDTPEMFFGRQDALNFLKNNLIGAHQRNVIILQGNRRTGKTSILKQVVNNDLFTPNIPVYIDCQGLGKLDDQGLFYKIARAMVRNLSKYQDVDETMTVHKDDISADDPFYDFTEFLDHVSEVLKNRRVILLIDEFEVIDDAIQKQQLSPEILENLRHLFQHRKDLAVVLTGSYRLRRLSQEYWSALFGLGLTYDVGVLDEDSARRLVTQPLRGKVTYTEEAIERILELTACQPYFMQMLCHDLVNVINFAETNFVTLSIVEDAAQETLTSADGHLRFMFRSAGSPVHQALLVYLASGLSSGESGQSPTLPGYQIDRFVQDQQLPLELYQLENILRDLANQDLLIIQGEIGRRLYGFKIDLVRQWIRRNYDLQSAIKLAQSTPYVREE